MSSTKKIAAAILTLTAIPLAGLAMTAVPASADPADMIEQVGVPASGNCGDVTDGSLNRAGVPSGGWGKAWAQWIAAPLGGPVCTRTLWFNNSTQKWAVR